MSQVPDSRYDAEPHPLPAGSELERLICFALESAKSLGADSADARIGVANSLKVKVREGQVDTLQQERDHSFTVSAYIDHRSGSANCNQFNRDAIRAAVEAACTIAGVTSQDPCQGLADADLLAEDPVELDLYHPWQLQPEGAIEVARVCEAAGLAHDPRLVNSDGASVATSSSLACYGNSHGFLATTNGTRHSLSCVLVAGDEQGMQRDYWYSTNRKPEHLDTAEAIGLRAGERAVARLGSAPVKTATVPVLFEAPAARSLVGHLLSAISGRNLYRKSSFLLGKLNQPVCAPHVHIEERPHLPGALGSSAFDREGVATRDRDLVRNGVLQTYLLGSYAARRLGMRSTGHAGGTHNVLVRSEKPVSFEALLESLGTGLLVTELMGQGVNMLTGDYSRGAAGFWIENGKVRQPVSGVTIAGNLLDMFTGIEAIGDDVDRRANIQTGAILVARMTLAGA